MREAGRTGVRPGKEGDPRVHRLAECFAMGLDKVLSIPDGVLRDADVTSRRQPTVGVQRRT